MKKENANDENDNKNLTACVILISAQQTTAAATFTGLGDLPGEANRSRAFGISADGSVVVGFSASALGGEAFRWTASGGMVGLGNLPAGGAIISGNAFGISADGLVAVGVADSASGRGASGQTVGGGNGLLRQTPRHASRRTSAARKSFFHG